MADTDFLPRRLDRAFDRVAFPEAVKALLVANGGPSHAAHWDDFFGDALDARYSATSGTGVEVVGVTAGVNGTMTLTTGANANDSAGQSFGLHWNGTNGVYFICRFKIDSVTSSKFEVGLTGTLTLDTGGVNAKATPTFTATDLAVLCFDTADDTLITFLSNGGAVDGNADGPAAAADTYYICEIVIQNGVASGYLDGKLIGSGNISASNPLSPWVYVETNTTATKTLTVDYWGIIGPRS